MHDHFADCAVVLGVNTFALLFHFQEMTSLELLVPRLACISFNTEAGCSHSTKIHRFDGLPGLERIIGQNTAYNMLTEAQKFISSASVNILKTMF